MPKQKAYSKKGWYCTVDKQWMAEIDAHLQKDDSIETPASTVIWFADAELPFKIAPLPNVKEHDYNVLFTERTLTYEENKRLALWFDVVAAYQDIFSHRKLVGLTIHYKGYYCSSDTVIQLVRDMPAVQPQLQEREIMMKPELLPECLSASERIVIQEVLSGKNNKEIARTLYYSPNSITSMLNRIFHKLDLSSKRKPALIQQGIRDGWIVIRQVRKAK
ncbi:response regulator transcription factor [Bacillus daqingensis]|uniref:Response regulator transcription factor n=1 Tax=Bacillus daqingensis TaxID=872396 RepID=A0ABV9NXI7_9BACI